MPRHIAAIIDNILALLLAAVSAKQFPEDWFATHVAVATCVYLGYFFLFEMILGRTPGKFMTGLVVLDYSGIRCSPRQAAIRTAFRLIEVNPVVIGALPAAVLIILSRNKQRFGDLAAGTIVVRSLPPSRG